MSPNPAPGGPVQELARAKINLCLNVTGRRADGYHLLESLVVFPECGDALTVEPGAGLSLALRGPFSADLDAGEGNIALRAADALRALAPRDAGATLLLEKRLPIASGMGGGSADAAATLRALRRLWGVEADDARWGEIALSLGADVPVCLNQRPVIMAGVGERLAPAPAFPEFWVVLVNPLVETPTGEVFRDLETAANAPLSPPPAAFSTLGGLAEWLHVQRNDLEAPAKRLRPIIGEALRGLNAQGGAQLARMTGSGATCFGLFADASSARTAADGLRAAHSDWWVVAARVPAYDPAQDAAAENPA